MRLLLDTCAMLWLMGDETQLAPDARTAILDSENDLLFSAASSWEIAIKVAIGKLRLPDPPRTLADQMKANAIQSLPIEPEHAMKILQLQPLHTDPFDRMLVAQALVAGLTILTPDAAIRAYGVPTLW